MAFDIPLVFFFKSTLISENNSSSNFHEIFKEKP